MSIIAPNYVNDMKWHNHNADNFSLIHKKRTILKHMLNDFLPFNCHTSTLKFDLKIFDSLNVFEILRITIRSYYRHINQLVQGFLSLRWTFIQFSLKVHSAIFQHQTHYFHHDTNVLWEHKKIYDNFSLERWAEMSTKRDLDYCSIVSFLNHKGSLLQAKYGHFS